LRAQRLVAEARVEDPDLSLNAAVLRIGPRVGVNPGTLRGWCKQAAIDAGERPGTSTVITAAGAVANSSTYDPYGVTTAGSGTVLEPFRDTSAYTDTTTGLIKLGARYYDPTRCGVAGHRGPGAVRLS
jgi:hypothetical protein